MVDSPLDIGVGALGVLVTFFSLMGLLAAKREKLWLLQWYAGLLSVCAVALLVLCGLLFVSDIGDIETWAGSSETQTGALQPRTLQNLRSLVQMLQTHRLLLSATMVLMLFLMAMNISMVCSLRWLLVSDRYYYAGIVDRVDSASEGADDDMHPLHSREALHSDSGCS